MDLNDHGPMDEALLEQRTQLRVITDSSPALISYLDSDLRYRFVNRRYENWFGITRDEIVGKPMEEVLGSEAVTVLKPHIEAVLRGETVHFESLVPYQASGEKWIDAQYVPDVGADGKVRGFFVFVIDITARKLAEARELDLANEALATKAKFEAIFNQSEIFAAILDLNGNVVEVNDLAVESCGFTKDEVLGKPFWQTPWWRESAEVQSQIRAAVETALGGGVYHKVLPYWRKDGTEHQFEFALHPIRDHAGKVIFLHPTGVDITERMLAEARVHGQMQTLEIIHHVGTALAGELDLEKLLQAVTDAGREISGAAFGAFFYNVEADGESYRLYTISGAPREAFSKFTQPRATDLFGPTFRGEAIVRLPDVLEDPRYGKNPPFHGIPEGHLAVRSYLAVPVKSRSGEVIGGLFFGHPEPNVFTQQTEIILHAIAAQAAVAIDNARLYGEAQAEIEERRRAVHALRESEATFRAMFSVSSVGKVQFDPISGRFLRVNNAMCQYLGYTEEELLKMTHKEVSHPDDRIRDEDTLNQLFQGNIPSYETEKRYLRKDGGVVWAHLTVNVIRDEQERPWRYTAIIQDISERRKTEETLQESERRLRTLVSNLPGMAYRCRNDKRRSMEFISERVIDMTGYQKSEYESNERSWMESTHPDDVEEVSKGLQEALEDHRPYQLEYRIINRDGNVHWVYEKGEGVYSESGHVVALEGFVLDISERKSVEAERERLLESEQLARTEAERASRLKDEFLALLSHELRTPLNAILGWSQLLNRPELRRDQDALEEGVQSIARSAEIQAQLIDDLLDMSRILSDKVHLKVEPVNLQEVIRSAIATVKPSADAKGVVIEQDTSLVLGSVLAGDPARLQQIVWNLLSNAVKFSSSGGVVKIILRRVENTVEIVVEDSGRGIKPQFLDHVFDRFRQADSSTTRTHGGLGLGLAIVKSLVELHGGTVTAQSEGEGRGATFTVSLPLQATSSIDRPFRASKGPKAVELAGTRVLIIDDEPHSLAYERRVMEECGASVSTASSVDQAFRILDSAKFDVLICDIGMPGRDGYDFIRTFRMGQSASRSAPVIALTAFARPEDRDRAEAEGFDLHAAKPVEPEALRQIVAGLLAQAKKGTPDLVAPEQG
ncbi:MAG: Sensor histidine kinase RcsC [Fimbriimonadaceae bacterium]|nr:Sensor histidine kinase RcsC [Fimbriimonadaceae bacterium]